MKPRWREDVDLIAKTLTVNQQTRNGETKGTRRTVPMTVALHDPLKRISTICEGLVIRNPDGSAKSHRVSCRHYAASSTRKSKGSRILRTQ